MKKVQISISLALFLLFVSTNLVSEVHPLIGIWKCKYIISGVTFTDYLRITSVSTSGYVKGYDQNNSAITGYTKNKMVFITHAKGKYSLASYYWGYDGIVFARMLLVYPYGSYPYFSKWYSVVRAAKTEAIPPDLPDGDSTEWLLFQSVLIDTLQSKQE